LLALPNGYADVGRNEFKIISELYSDGIRTTQEIRQKYNLTLDECPPAKERFQPLLKKYLEMTGFEETVPAAIMHHRISLYGPPCKHCGKPLRTPAATFCAFCGQPAS
jgi:hypothetical protein